MRTSFHAHRRVLRAAGSVQMAMILLGLGVVLFAVGTLVESRSGRELAQASVYATAWFDSYLALIAINLIAAVVNRIPIQRHQWSFVLTHFSIVLLLAGAWISRTFGYEGTLPITEGAAESRLFLEDSEVVLDERSGAAEGGDERAFALPRRGNASGLVFLASSPGEVGLRVVDHIASGRIREALRSGAEDAEPGLEMHVRGGERDSHAWLLAGDPRHGARDLGDLETSLLHMISGEELEERLTARATLGAVLEIVPGEGLEPVRIQLPEHLHERMAVSEGVELVVTRYLERARVIDGELTDMPGAPPNPAAVVEIRSGDRVETHTTFSLFPEFNLVSDGTGLVSSVSLRGGPVASRPRIVWIVGPSDELYLQLETGEGRKEAIRVDLTKPIPISDLDLVVEVESFLPRATVDTEIVTCAPDDEGASPFVRLALSVDGEEHIVDVERGSRRWVDTGDRTFGLEFRRRTLALPFSAHLKEFLIRYHPGSRRPASYESHLTLTALEPPGEAVSTAVSMNRPLDYQGFRLFQSSYVEGRAGAPDTTLLTVSYDPGVGVVYVSFVLLIVGIAWYLLGSGGRRRRTDEAPVPAVRLRLRSELDPPVIAGTATPTPAREEVPMHARFPGSISGLLVCISAAVFGSFGHADTGVPEDFPLESTAGWAVLSEGRVKPLETVAREFTLAVTGRESLLEMSATEIFWGFLLDADSFSRLDLIRIDSKDLKAEIGLPPAKRRFSFHELMQNAEFRGLVESGLGRKHEGGEPTSLEQDALAGYMKLELVAETVQGASLRIVPVLQSGGMWSTPQQMRGSTNPEQAGIYEAFSRLAAAYRSGDGPAFAAEADVLTRALRDAGPGVYPSPDELDLELFYNRFNAFGKAWVLYLVAFCLILFLGLGGRRLGYGIGLLALAGGFACHSAGIGLRWAIAGRAPVSDMYESLLFMGWGISAIGLVLELVYRKGYFAVCAGLMGFLALAFSENLPIDSSINPLVPVLANTYWLSVHVMTIMLSYSAFAIAMAMGHVILGIQLFRPGRTELLRTVSLLLYKTLQVGLLFLAAGICFGAIWANESWGRYWGWDPKETWSLITFFAYLGLVHARFAGWTRDFGLGVLSICCFLSVIMTYYGVNFILGAGLHSYGFASGGTVYAALYVLIEVGIILLATAGHRRARARRMVPAPTS